MSAAHRLHRSPLYQQHFATVIDDDLAAMRLALELASLAATWQEVPVGAVIIDAQQRVIGMGVNQTIYAHDPTQHAEIAALRDACLYVGNYRLPGAQLFVSLEPCMMCMGAMLHARLQRVVYGAIDPKTGVCQSVLKQQHYAALNHQTQILGGVLADESSQLLKSFFRARRQNAKAAKDLKGAKGIKDTQDIQDTKGVLGDNV